MMKTKLIAASMLAAGLCLSANVGAADKNHRQAGKPEQKASQFLQRQRLLGEPQRREHSSHERRQAEQNSYPAGRHVLGSPVHQQHGTVNTCSGRKIHAARTGVSGGGPRGR